MTTELGAKIRAARLARGWSQTELAQQLGSTKKSVGVWERTGVISPLSMGRLAKVLGLDAHGHWMEEEAPAVNGHQHYRRLTMEAPLPELTASEPLVATLQRLRRDLTRITAELDKALEALEAQSK